jgi:hypothetical protein
LELEGVMASVVAPLIERWDGERWRVERAANPGSDTVELYAISCDPSDRCVAVGSQRLRRRAAGTLAEIWDGNAWRLMPTQDHAGSSDSELLDVACPRPDRCIAVGYWSSGSGLRPLIESWDGKRWRIEPITMPSNFSSGSLNSIDCPVPTTCQAVGTYDEGSPILHGFSAALVDGDWKVLPIPGT